MTTANKTVRQSLSLPANIAAQVRTLAKTRRLSSDRMLVELRVRQHLIDRMRDRAYRLPQSTSPWIESQPEVPDGD